MACVEIDIIDYIDDISTEELLAELTRRRQDVPCSDQLLYEAYEYLAVGQAADATIALHKFLFPKWETIDECQIDYQRAKAA